MVTGGCIRNAVLFGHELSIASLISDRAGEYSLNSCPTVTACDFTPCANGAACMSHNDTFLRCDCVTKYSGEFCTSEFHYLLSQTLNIYFRLHRCDTSPDSHSDPHIPSPHLRIHVSPDNRVSCCPDLCPGETLRERGRFLSDTRRDRNHSHARDTATEYANRYVPLPIQTHARMACLTANQIAAFMFYL